MITFKEFLTEAKKLSPAQERLMHYIKDRGGDPTKEHGVPLSHTAAINALDMRGVFKTAEKRKDVWVIALSEIGMVYLRTLK